MSFLKWLFISYSMFFVSEAISMSAIYVEEVGETYYIFEYSIRSSEKTPIFELGLNSLIGGFEVTDDKVIINGCKFIEEYKETSLIHDIKTGNLERYDGIMIDDIYGSKCIGTHDYGIEDYLRSFFNNEFTDGEAELAFPDLGPHDLRIVEYINGKRYSRTKGGWHFAPKYIQDDIFVYFTTLISEDAISGFALNIVKDGIIETVEIPDAYHDKDVPYGPEKTLKSDVYGHTVLCATNYYLLSYAIDVNGTLDTNDNQFEVILETDEPIINFNVDDDGDAYLFSGNVIDENDEILIVYNLNDSSQNTIKAPNLLSQINIPFVIVGD